MDTEIVLWGGAVKGFARKAGLSLTKVAEQIEGVSLSHLSRVVAGDRECSWDLLRKLAFALQVKPEEIAEIRLRADRSAA